MKRRARRRWRGEEGASYVIVLIAVAVLGMVTATAAQQWTVVMKREREAEFWFRAQRIQRALERYGADSEIMKATRLNRYPLRLDDLTARPKR
jgi:type II secretory pathway component PulK